MVAENLKSSGSGALLGSMVSIVSMRRLQGNVRSFLAHRAQLLALGTWALGSGCGGFFEELQSADSADTDEGETTTETTGGGGDTETMGCVLPDDDRCLDQDTVQHCDPEAQTVELVSCTQLCGTNTNFSCVTVAPGVHGCWCVVPGDQKIDSCAQLETCLQGCADPTGPCPDQCFGRTTPETVRLYGTLVHCAQASCHETCGEAPELCAGCIGSALADGTGGCGLARSVCDADLNDDPFAPYE